MGVVAADVATSTATGVVTVCVASLADAGTGTVGVSGLANAGMAFPVDLVGLTTMGVTDVTDVVRSPESGSDVVMWDVRMWPGAWCHVGTLSHCYVDCQYVGCDPVSVDCAGPAAGLVWRMVLLFVEGM